MSKARHHKASGGGIGRTDSMAEPKDDFDKNAGVEKDAREEGRGERKHGGKVKRKEHKHGGKVEHHVDGHAAKHRMDRPRPGRRSGGRCGADMAPLSSANKTRPAMGRSVESSEEGG